MKQQQGGTLIGFILGLIVGLAIALGVAVYVTKVPIPFMNKAQMRSAEQDEAEARRNKDWDPNTPLQGKNPARVVKPADAASSPAVAASAADPKPLGRAAAGAIEPRAQDAKAADAGKAPGKGASTKPGADPLGDLARAKQAASEALTYYVQVGAFRTMDDAQAQRAQLSLDGIETRITEREQSGRMVYRVRTGPFDSLEAAERSKAALEQAGLQPALVRVQPAP